MFRVLLALEMNSKRRYKICIYSVILGKLEVFRNDKGFSVIFLKILGATEQLTKYRRHFELGHLQKIVGHFFSKIVPEWNTCLEIFNRIQVIENSRQYLLLRTDILQKTVVGRVPLIKVGRFLITAT